MNSLSVISKTSKTKNKISKIPEVSKIIRIFERTHTTYITYSRNVFIPLTKTCRNSCKYCNFRVSEANLMELKDVEKLASKAKQLGCKEALLTFGEKPEVYREFRKKLKNFGFSSFLDYIIKACKICINKGLLPHTNAGVLLTEEMKKLKPFNASMGLMLEQAVELECHSDSPGKNPEVRVKTIERAGKLQIPFTTGLLLGIGESEYDRFYSLEVIYDLHKNWENIQEIIIQPCIMNGVKKVQFNEIKRVVECAKNMGIPIQIPPNLVSEKELIGLLNAGAKDLGGISPLTLDYINPSSPWPSITYLEEKLEKHGYLLKERLPIYPKFVKKRWFGCEVSKIIEDLAKKMYI